jgi:hypothetical protein
VSKRRRRLGVEEAIKLLEELHELNPTAAPLWRDALSQMAQCVREGRLQDADVVMHEMQRRMDDLFQAQRAQAEGAAQ